jgi:hypothetical protein
VFDSTPRNEVARQLVSGQIGLLSKLDWSETKFKDKAEFQTELKDPTRHIDQRRYRSDSIHDFSLVLENVSVVCREQSQVMNVVRRCIAIVNSQSELSRLQWIGDLRS